MRYALALAALAAGAIAVPFADNNGPPEYGPVADVDVSLDTHIEYVTNVVTVTAFGPPPPPGPTQPPNEPPAQPPAPPTKPKHYGHKGNKPPPPTYGGQAPPSPPKPEEPVPAPPVDQPPPAYSAPPASPPAYEPSPEDGSLDTYAKAALDAHNSCRSKHDMHPLTYDKDLEACAQTLASLCEYKHDVTIASGGIQPGQYGQNIAAGVGAGQITKIIVDMFYEPEEAKFSAAGAYGMSQPPPEIFEDTGHFTQIVWNNTIKFGCSTQICPQLKGVSDDVPKVFTVCNYFPPGNYDGQYADNVFPPKSGSPSPPSY